MVSATKNGETQVCLQARGSEALYLLPPTVRWSPSPHKTQPTADICILASECRAILHLSCPAYWATTWLLGEQSHFFYPNVGSHSLTWNPELKIFIMMGRLKWEVGKPGTQKSQKTPAPPSSCCIVLGTLFHFPIVTPASRVASLLN